MVENDLAPWLGHCDRIFFFLYFRDGIENLEHALCAVDTVRPPVKNMGEEVHRSGKLSDIADKGNQYSEIKIRSGKN